MDSHEKSQSINTESRFGDNAGTDLNNPEPVKGDNTLNLKLDRHGLPLVPQPTSHKDDPLVRTSSR